jgi:hypothetical protein
MAASHPLLLDFNESGKITVFIRAGDFFHNVSPPLLFTLVLHAVRV